MCLLSGRYLNTSCFQYSDESTRSKCEIFILSEKLKKRSLAGYPHVFFSFLKLYSKFPFSKFDPHFISSYIAIIFYSFFLAWITIRPWHIAMRVFQVVFCKWSLRLSSLFYMHATLMPLPTKQWVHTNRHSDRREFQFWRTFQQALSGFSNTCKVYDRSKIWLLIKMHRSWAQECLNLFIRSENFHKIHCSRVYILDSSWLKTYYHAKYVLNRRWFAEY